jgi:glycosyltransferase involved in cell wall biosynthesis
MGKVKIMQEPSSNAMQIRVLHVTLNMGFGGTEAVIRELVAWDDAGRVHHEVICIDGSIGAIGQQLLGKGVAVQVLKRRPGFDRVLIGDLKKLIISQRFDIVHCHQYTPWIYGCLASIGTPAKVMFTEHGRFHPDRHRYKAMVVNRVLALFTHKIVAISSATRDALARYEFLPKKRIEVLYNGIKPLNVDQAAVAPLRTELAIADDDFILGTVARLDPVKNQSMMLGAFAQVRARHSGIKLIIVGDGTEREALEDKAAALKITSSVIFIGFSDEPRHYLALMDLFLLSSDTEGTSITLLEAMSLGLPVVATATGGTPEIVDHDITGLLTPIGDADAFATAIETLLRNPDQLKAKGEAGLVKFQKNYSIESMAGQYLAGYDQLFEGARSREQVYRV